MSGTPSPEPTLADRAVETLRSYDTARKTDPAWHATRLDRVIARGLDMLVIAAAGAIVILVLLISGTLSDRNEDGPPDDRVPGDPVDTITWGPTTPTARGVAAMGVIAGVLFVYELGTTALLGATPGKRLMKIRIRTYPERSDASLGRVALRTLLWALPLTIAIALWYTSILFAWIAAGALIWYCRQLLSRETDGRTTCDLLARTVVTKVTYGPD